MRVRLRSGITTEPTSPSPSARRSATSAGRPRRSRSPTTPPCPAGQQLAAGHVEHGRLDRVRVECLPRLGVHGRRHVQERDGERNVLDEAHTHPSRGAVSWAAPRARRRRVAPLPVILFDWLRDGNRDIYRAGLDGKTRAADVRPRRRSTPDGGRGRRGLHELRTGTVSCMWFPDGGAEQRLTTTTANETQPALSPDGGVHRVS